jgi:hypothetical protein
LITVRGLKKKDEENKEKGNIWCKESQKVYQQKEAKDKKK